MLTSFLRWALPLTLTLGAGTASAAPCAAGSLASYVALGAGGCSIGSMLVYNMAIEAFPGPTAVHIAPGGVSLAPTLTGFSLTNTSAILAGPGQLFGLRISFGLLAPSIAGGTVSLAGGVVGGDGALTGVLDAGSAGNAIAVVVDGFSAPTASFTSASTTTYATFFELGVDGGTLGSASLGPNLATLSFGVSPVPEPCSTALLAIGLAALAAKRRSPGDC